MSKIFKGRPVIAGTIDRIDAVVSRQGVNTLASFQKSALKKASEVICSDQNNPDLYKKNLTKKALCLPQTIGSTTGGMVLYSVCALGIAPSAMLFSQPIDSLAAAGVILSDVWTDGSIVAVDNLGEEFLNYVKDGMKISVAPDGTVTVD
jgi:predicted aconitase with swiveling domain